ncbi:gamma-tubulin complex component 3 [Malaya genurostris]|uniref:gamma-tubulin complex component 3 n=1 Tax=Malaya genurostris TaxID=325434 RepID=UPI0026F3AC49|nr:gamma-tubulin complex component 3 [Malaya genurostris]XP_058445426.1 gamma-tubulin complex component 3 [Malaya genurostris]
MHSQRQQNYTEIYELLRKLCKTLAGDRYGSLLKGATQLIANTPNSISASGSDESSIVARIGQHLTASGRSQSDSALFRGLHEQLCAYTDSKRRAQILEFFLLLADSDGEGQTNGRLLNLNVDLRSDMSSGSVPNRGAEMNLRSPGTDLESIFSRIELRTRSTDNGVSGLRVMPFKGGSSSVVPDGRSSTASGELSEEEIQLASNNLQDQLIQDVIYACTGIQGKYLRKHVVTGEFKLDHIKGRTLSISDAGMVLQLAEVGHFHNKVLKFTDSKSDCYMKGNFGQGYISALQQELTQYYGMLAILQEDLNRQRREGLSSVGGERLTLMKLRLWLAGPMERFQWLAQISDSCKDLKGGALATVIHDYTSNGHPENRKCALELLRAACVPLQHALIRWLINGEIVDPNCEFFIEEISEVGFDQLWHQKYRIRRSMLPGFVSDTMAKRILVIGKSINFLREVCQDKTPVKARNDLKQCLEHDLDFLFSPVSTSKLHLLIDSVYLNTSKQVLDIVLGPHRLLDHLQALRNYLLLGQGHFTDLLMENLHSELDRPASEIFQHDLFSILAAAVRISSAEKEEPEVLNYLDVHFLTHYEGESGWDVFGLTYKVCGPLSTILEPSLCRYQTFFKHLWNMKHVEFMLCRTWKRQMLDAKSLRPLQKHIGPIILRLQLTTSQMINFICQMQYYILFEVIECSWVQFLPRVNQAKALDDILEAHHQFLEEIRIGIFLDDTSQHIVNTLDHVFHTVRKLEGWQERFYRLCFTEHEARKTFQDQIKSSEQKGKYGITTEQMLERDEQAKTFEQHLSTHQTLLQEIGNEYENFVGQFLYQLAISTSETLRQLGMRLDYNECYKHRDRRLSVPLTFQHMRMSMAANSFRSKKVASSSMLY